MGMMSFQGLLHMYTTTVIEPTGVMLTPSTNMYAAAAALQWSGRTEQLHQQSNRDIVETSFNLVRK